MSKYAGRFESQESYGDSRVHRRFPRSTHFRVHARSEGPVSREGRVMQDELQLVRPGAPAVQRDAHVKRKPSGWGDVFASVANRLGFRSCTACHRFSASMNRWSLRPLFSAAAASDNCRSYSGPCTGFGKRQCVLAPSSFEPDAPVIEQCCGGWFQYPWIQVCEGQAPRVGCGFCLW